MKCGNTLQKFKQLMLNTMNASWENGVICRLLFTYGVGVKKKKIHNGKQKEKENSICTSLKRR